MRLRPWKKPEQPARPAESARPPEPEPPIHPLSDAAFRRQHGRRLPRLPQLRPGEAESMLEADIARRQAEQAAASARLQGELAAEQARQEATADAMYEQFLSESLWITDDGNGKRDPRDIQF